MLDPVDPDFHLLPEDIDLFFSMVKKGNEKGCWEWTGPFHNTGYGHIPSHLASREERLYAHRFALMMKLGRAIHTGKWACHTCDNRKCVNPEHIYEGTARTNARDRWERTGHKKGS